MLTLIAAVAILPANLAPLQERNLRIDDLYPRIPWSGKTARGVSWSHDSRYLAYLWNPYDEPYSDLWVYDAKEGKSNRLTSIEVMKQFDKSLAKATVRYQEDRRERDKMLLMSDEEYRTYRQDRKKEARRRGSRPEQAKAQLRWHQRGHLGKGPRRDVAHL